MNFGVLIDAGPLVAILNREDRDHDKCLDLFKSLQEPLLSTWMPITEAMHLLNYSSVAQNALLEMIERGVLKILELGTEDLPPIRSLIRKYSDQPMDFADATLVHVADREGLREIFTLDRCDFTIYKLKQGRTLSVIP